MRVRKENVVPGKSKKPPPDSHQNLSATSCPYIQSLQKISTLTPTAFLHNEDANNG